MFDLLVLCMCAQADRFIVLYDEDEKMGIQAAAVFVQRGIDNVCLLSGGMLLDCFKVCLHQTRLCANRLMLCE